MRIRIGLGWWLSPVVNKFGKIGIMHRNRWKAHRNAGNSAHGNGTGALGI